MKKVFSFLKAALFITSLYYLSERFIVFMLPTYKEDQYLSLIIKYGFLIGYIFFIVFLMLIQTDNYTQLRKLKPKQGSILQISQLLCSTIFLSYIFMDFNVRFSFILILVYLAVTSVFDYLIEKSINDYTVSISHQKKII